MQWIGLTGGIATGKSTVTRILRAKGFPVVCADELARAAVQNGSPGLRRVVATFGPEVLTADGDLDRKKLGSVVFADAAKRQALESIIHPEVRRLMEEQKGALQARGAALAFYDVPLLFEKNMQNSFDAVVVVVCDESVQRQRLAARDGLPPEEVERRLRAQLPLAEKRARANHVLVNNGTLEELERQVMELVATLATGSTKPTNSPQRP